MNRFSKKATWFAMLGSLVAGIALHAGDAAAKDDAPTHGMDCWDNGHAGTNEGHTVCCPAGQLRVAADGNSASCADPPADPPSNPEPGAPPVVIGTPRGGGGGGSGDPAPTPPPECNAACKAEKKRRCLAQADDRATACNNNARDFFKYCMDTWATNAAVDKCTGGGGHIGIGIDGAGRPPIQALQDCEYVDLGTDGNGHPRPPLVLCHPRLDSLDRPDWWDPQTHTSAWANNGCLEDWCDGVQGGSVGNGGGQTHTGGYLEVSSAWASFLSVGGRGPSISNTTNTSQSITVDSHTGLYAQCSAAHTTEITACGDQRKKERDRCE